MAEIRIGISGWRYGPWRGAFYPEGLPQRSELWYASRRLSAIEINGSFYSLQRPTSYADWYTQTPASFLFTVKGPRFITHMKKLQEVEIPLANFFASGVFNLREKLGPILWQFPPSFRYDRARFESFFDLLPQSTSQALRLARKRHQRMYGRSRLAIDLDRPLRYAIEVRNESFLDDDFVTLLRDHHIALTVAETAGKWPLMEDVTTDFLYVRLHGDEELYRSGYGDAALNRWAARIRAWHRGAEPRDARRISSMRSGPGRPRDVFCFFDNTDVKLRAPVDAQSLMFKLGIDLQPQTPHRPSASAPGVRSN